MDNLAHTLLGLALAKAGIERSTPMATAALVISSNLPDVDVFARIGGDALDYVQCHRGFTHSFVGLLVLAGLLTPVLTYVARRRGHVGVKPLNLFLAACLGGLGHLFMDFTNAYGVRPLLPFNARWFYGDLVVVVDPWIWLILGSSAVWLTSATRVRIGLWVVLGVLTSLLMAIAFRSPTESGVVIPTSIRIIWFAGLAGVATAAALLKGKGNRNLARWSLVILAAYYGATYVARNAVVERLRTEFAAAEVTAWPTPANPTLWQVVIAGPDAVQTGLVSLFGNPGAEIGFRRQVAPLDPSILEALRRAERPRAFLDFTRFVNSKVDKEAEGYRVNVRDLRFNLHMDVILDRDLNVRATRVGWF